MRDLGPTYRRSVESSANQQNLTGNFHILNIKQMYNLVAIL